MCLYLRSLSMEVYKYRSVIDIDTTCRQEGWSPPSKRFTWNGLLNIMLPNKPRYPIFSCCARGCSSYLSLISPVGACIKYCSFLLFPAFTSYRLCPSGFTPGLYHPMAFSFHPDTSESYFISVPVASIADVALWFHTTPRLLPRHLMSALGFCPIEISSFYHCKPICSC